MSIKVKQSLDLTTADAAGIVAAATESAGAKTLVTTDLGGLRQLVATTVADETVAGNTFVIVGSAKGIVVTETMVLPSASTVVSTKYYDTITSVTTTENDLGDVSLGTNQVEVSQWVAVNTDINPVEVTFGVVVSGTINYTLEYAVGKNDTDLSLVPEAVFDHAVLDNLTTSAVSTSVVPIIAVRLRSNSFTAGAGLDLNFIQSGYYGR